jgi:hypothetical protein
MPHSYHKLLLLPHGGAVAPQTFNSYVAELGATLYYDMLATAGATETNLGSVGAGLNGNIVSCTVGQAGFGSVANTAFDWDGIDDAIEIPDHATFDASEWTFAFLANHDARGENGNFDRWLTMGNDTRLAWNANNLKVRMVVEGGTPADSQMTFASTLVGSWQFLWFVLAADKKVYGYRSVGGGVVEATYDVAQVALVTPTANSGTSYLGNRATYDRTIDAQIDKFLFFPSALTTAQMLLMSQLIGLDS